MNHASISTWNTLPFPVTVRRAPATFPSSAPGAANQRGRAIILPLIVLDADCEFWLLDDYRFHHPVADRQPNGPVGHRLPPPGGADPDRIAR